VAGARSRPASIFVRLAEGMGCAAVRVETSAELMPALKRAFTETGTNLIEVIVDSAVPILYGQKH
jgi:Thiamine pyrophosphate-requiring enzymes [acetolactate synthase, pyruvate dehydrogenase (cytochrome), glyoxylate carboligase, phosphonopyruvate decarboxylase]